jgi:putative ABC transport system ATP-binding protein
MDNYPNAIEFKSLSKAFINDGKSEPVLKKINATVHTNSVLTIMGPSGSGKSTILSLCNLLLTPDEGEVFVQEKEVREWNIPELRRTVGLAFQTAPMIAGSVLDNLLLASIIHNKKIDQPEEFLHYVGLPGTILSKNAQDLSGGQKQRLALARTLVNRPSILLLDEITSALDPTSVREVEELILRINREQKTTVVWVTHDLEQARRVGNEAWLIVDGQLVEKGSTEEFFQNPTYELTKQFLAKGMKENQQ